MNKVKFAAGIVLVNALRFVRVFPNNDPIMGVMLPFARQQKWWSAAAFAFIAMVSFDLITSGIGAWTWVTAFTYAAIGIGAHFYFKNRQKIGLKNYLGAGIAGVLVFDFVTGVLFGPTLFGTPMKLAFIAQIPFTALHLLSASVYIAVLAPLLDRHLVNSPQLSDERLAKLFFSDTKLKL